MGFIREKHGRISIESRSVSFRVHPTYGYERECPVCEGDPPPSIMGPCVGGCTAAFAKGEVDEPGHVPDFADTSFGEQWRKAAHPEFLIEDLDDLIAALIDYRNDL